MNGDNNAYYSKMLSKLDILRTNLRLDTNSKTTIEIALLEICRGL